MRIHIHGFNFEMGSDSCHVERSFGELMDSRQMTETNVTVPEVNFVKIVKYPS